MTTHLSRLSAAWLALWVCLAGTVAFAQSPPANVAPNAHVSRLVEGHNAYALGLAGRGACFSAEEEYFKAMWIVARNLDEVGRTTKHSQALSAARLAFTESEDFATYLPDKADQDVRPHIIGHQTKLLHGSEQPITALAALQSYYALASEQLVLAVGTEAGASESLSGLAKIQSVLMIGINESTAPAKAIALYQAAIEVNPNNALAANELGVLMAKYGRFEAAKGAFTQSLRAEPNPKSWHNLAKVCDQLGEHELAAKARENAQRLQSTSTTKGQGTAIIDWVDNAAFTSRSNRADGLRDDGDANASGRSQTLEPHKQTARRTERAPDAPKDKKDAGLLKQLMDFTKRR